ncbi:MAG: TonB C-terminal domain-containing protein [Gammaproteobacteria bacterium]
MLTNRQHEELCGLPPTGKPLHRAPSGSHVGALRLGIGMTLAALIAWLAWMSLQLERPRESPVQAISVLDQPLPDPLEPEPEPEPVQEYEEPAASEEFVELTAAPVDIGNTLDDALGVDADGSGGGDGFGLRAKRGGRALIGAEHGTADDPAAAWRGFATLVAKRLERLLNANGAVRAADYDLRVRLWLAADGRVARVELAGSSGMAAVDAAIVNVLEDQAGTLGEPPPDMPQPVNIRVRSRSAG